VPATGTSSEKLWHTWEAAPQQPARSEAGVVGEEIEDVQSLGITLDKVAYGIWS